MESEPAQEQIDLPQYRVKWHQNIEEDFSKISKPMAGNIIENAEHRLSRAPQFLGQPLKGTTNLIWKIRFSKYRILYTMNPKAKEVWILSVQKRDLVYRDRHVQSLVKLALAIQNQIDQG